MVMTAVHGDRKGNVAFSHKSQVAAIDKVICLELGIAVGSLIHLRTEMGQGATVDGAMSPGKHTFFVSPPMGEGTFSQHRLSKCFVERSL